MNELELPQNITDDKSSTELVRVWASNGRQWVVLRGELWDDPALYGIMIADLARHIADSFQVNGKRDAISALKRILEGLAAELG